MLHTAYCSSIYGTFLTRAYWYTQRTNQILLNVKAGSILCLKGLIHFNIIISAVTTIVSFSVLRVVTTALLWAPECGRHMELASELSWVLRCKAGHSAAYSMSDCVYFGRRDCGQFGRRVTGCSLVVERLRVVWQRVSPCSLVEEWLPVVL